MISQSRHFAETFNHARDTARPSHETVCEPMPPSKAHIRRLGRDRTRPFVDAVVNKPVNARTMTLREQNDWFKRQMADLGGNRTVAPSNDGVLYNAEQRGILNFVEPVKHEQTAVGFMEAMELEQAKIEAMKARLRARAAAERAKVETAMERAFRLGADVLGSLAEASGVTG